MTKPIRLWYLKEKRFYIYKEEFRFYESQFRRCRPVIGTVKEFNILSQNYMEVIINYESNNNKFSKLV